jgi:hypothetical protein
MRSVTDREKSSGCLFVVQLEASCSTLHEQKWLEECYVRTANPRLQVEVFMSICRYVHHLVLTAAKAVSSASTNTVLASQSRNNHIK